MKTMTFAQMRKNDKAVEHHWFTKGAMEFFNTKLIGKPGKYNMFLFTTQYSPENNTPLIYKVAIHIPANGKTFTMGDTDGFPTLAQVEAYRREIELAFDQAGAREREVIENMTYAGASSNTLTLYAGSKAFEIRTDGEGDPARRIIG